jgi:hypothetical protein
MKKYAAICATLAALAWTGVAAAATPQGKLTGSATINGGFTFAMTAPIIDGGMSYVGLENDKSGNCDGDSGTVSIDGNQFDVACAHYVASSKCCNSGSPKMRFAYQIETGIYVVFRITDNGASTDTVALGNTDTLAHATAWVNKGAIGGVGGTWSYAFFVDGDYTITASQT